MQKSKGRMIQGVFFLLVRPKNNSLPDSSEILTLRTFWWDLLCNLTLRTFRGAPVQKDTLYIHTFTWCAFGQLFQNLTSLKWQKSLKYLWVSSRFFPTVLPGLWLQISHCWAKKDKRSFWNNIARKISYHLVSIDPRGIEREVPINSWKEWKSA